MDTVKLNSEKSLIIKYQLINGVNDEPMDPVYTAETKPGESFETQRFYGNDPTRSRWVELRRKKDMIIPPVNEDGMPLQPRRIIKWGENDWRLSYGWPRGKSWSKNSMEIYINVIEIS